MRPRRGRARRAARRLAGTSGADPLRARRRNPRPDARASDGDAAAPAARVPGDDRRRRRGGGLRPHPHLTDAGGGARAQPALAAGGAPLRPGGARDHGAAAGAAHPRAIRAPAPLDRGAVAHRCGDVVAAARVGVAGGAAPARAGHAPGARGLPRGAAPPRRAPARQPAGAPAPIDAGAGARRARVGAPGDPAARQRPDGAHPAAARGTARPRAGSCAPLRLPRQPDPVGDRNAAVLPPGGVVDLRAGA